MRRPLIIGIQKNIGKGGGRLEKVFIIRNNIIYKWKRILDSFLKVLKRLIFFLLGFLGYIFLARLYFC